MFIIRGIFVNNNDNSNNATNAESPHLDRNGFQEKREGNPKKKLSLEPVATVKEEETLKGPSLGDLLFHTSSDCLRRTQKENRFRVRDEIVVIEARITEGDVVHLRP